MQKQSTDKVVARFIGLNKLSNYKFATEVGNYNALLIKNIMTIFLTTLIIFLIDQLSKFLVIRNMVLGESIPLISGIFHLTYIRNQGVAFGLFSSYSRLLTIISIILILSIFIFRKQLTQGKKWREIPLGLILGGALGNLTDRLIFGSITDFLDFRIWPVFNLADTAISVGIILLIWMFRK